MSAMNRDNIIRMAKEAGITVRRYYDEIGSTPEELERFAARLATERPPKWFHCDLHGAGSLAAWGCPECTKELREENERLNAEIESWRMTLAAATILGEKVTAENERLREEIDALRTDTERYRWLREHKFKHNGHCFALTGPILWETTLDAAIDAAMKQAALRKEEKK